MGMLGNQLAAGTALTIANDSFNGDGSTTAFTLSHAVSNVNDIEVLVDNVQQSPYDSSYSVSGTTLTFSGAPSAGTNNIYVIYNASKHITTSQVIPDNGSVTSSKLDDGSVTSSKLDTNIAVAGTFRSDGHAAVGANIISSQRALSVAGATDGSTSNILGLCNSSLASKFSVRDDGIVTAANLIIANGGVRIGGTGTGNDLDDYEEGFYTPTYGATAGYGNQTYTQRTGVYTKIGNIVKVWVDMTLSANSSQAGIPLITLPFAAASSANLGTDSVGAQRYDMGSWTPWAVSSTISSALTTGWIANSDQHITMYYWSGSHNYGHTALPLNATGRISGTIWYTAAF